ncbi:MAG TPA: ABC transporter permease subunit, partial [Anaerolineales bacterium]|nr:ABC transporter permease subunit [Anaerolineales bacterium]
MTLVARWFGSRFAPDSIPGRLRRDVWAWISGLIILLFIGGALFAPLLTSRAAEGEGEPNPPEKLLAPSAEHPFGTDQLGRDLYARVLFGGRTALTLGLLVVAVAVAVGVPLGAIAGYFGGWVDEVLMRLTDVFLAFPPLLLAIFIASALGASLTNAALAIAFTWWPWYT